MSKCKGTNDDVPITSAKDADCGMKWLVDAKAKIINDLEANQDVSIIDSSVRCVTFRFNDNLCFVNLDRWARKQSWCGKSHNCKSLTGLDNAIKRSDAKEEEITLRDEANRARWKQEEHDNGLAMMGLTGKPEDEVTSTWKISHIRSGYAVEANRLSLEKAILIRNILNQMEAI